MKFTPIVRSSDQVPGAWVVGPSLGGTRKEGEAALIIRQLTRLLGNLPEPQIQQIRSLPQAKLEALGEALLDFAALADLQHWLATEGNDEDQQL